MKVYIISKKDSNRVQVCVLIRESATKYFVWGNEKQTIEMHFPKDSYYLTNKI
jgi:hypothetical protein